MSTYVRVRRVPSHVRVSAGGEHEILVAANVVDRIAVRAGQAQSGRAAEVVRAAIDARTVAVSHEKAATFVGGCAEGGAVRFAPRHHGWLAVVGQRQRVHVPALAADSEDAGRHAAATVHRRV